MSAASIAVTARAAAQREARPPHNLLALTEAPRALGELISFYLLRPALRKLPRGDGHPVLVLPGFLASDASTVPMRSLLADLGYQVSGWELGRNVEITDQRIAAMADCVVRLHRRTGRKVSMIGWSLGGVLARELAKLHPEMVRQVISMGSPIAREPGHTVNVRRVFEAINGKIPEPQRRGRFLDLTGPPPVPSTVIYSRGDGVVAWRGALQPEGAQAENVAVFASHCGLGVNATVMWVIADRLAQREGRWSRFAAHGRTKLLFPRARDD